MRAPLFFLYGSASVAAMEKMATSWPFDNSDSIETYLVSNATTWSTNDTVCRMLGYGTHKVSQAVSTNNSHFGIMHNGSYMSGGTLFPNNASTMFVNVSSYFVNTSLWSHGSSDLSMLLLNDTTVGDNKTNVSTVSPEQHQSRNASEFYEILASVNATLLPDGALALSENVSGVSRAGHQFIALALAYANRTHQTDSQKDTALINSTTTGLAQLGYDLTQVASILNATGPVSSNGTVNWYRAAENCLGTSNHTKSHNETTHPKSSSDQTLMTINWPEEGEVGVWHVNRCADPYWFKVVAPEGEGDTRRVGPNERYFEAYHSSTKGNMAVKIANQNIEMLAGDIGIVQLEYGYSPEPSDRMWMDLSFIDCGPHFIDDPDNDLYRDLVPCPMREGGWLGRWIDADEHGCPFTYCPGVEDPTIGCTGAYMESRDYYGTKACVFGQENWNKLNFQITSCPSDEDLAKVDL